MKTESLIFDMDGTLWDSSENVAASWTEVLKREKIKRVITEEDMKSVMGLTMTDISDRLFPEMLPERRIELMNTCAEYENEYLSKHGGKLYEGITETLKILSKSHRLFIVSNCQSGYIEAFLMFYGLDQYFTDHLCWGDTHEIKGESIKLLMKKNNITDSAYVGDIQGDCDSARYAGIKFIHAAYGFGTVSDPDAVIHSFSDLLHVLE